MPRNGDGSGDNGPIEGHELLHGASGDKTLQHTKHVAPMPEQEAGDALPGMGAGGAAAPIADDAEQFGVNEPKKDPTEEEDEEPIPDHLKTDTSSKSSKKRDQPHHSATSPERSHLDQKFTKLDKDEVNMSTANSKGQEMDARAQRVADATEKSKGAGDEIVKKHGGHADVEELHGATSLEHGDKSKDGGKDSASGKKGGESESGNGGKGSEGGELSLGDKVAREQAKKFGANIDAKNQYDA
ncbi:hypothetical protein AA0117_g7950 [Alternaria alternata]|uniref:Uncharacterized protein n=2 Tax=Alternaria alternata complex TaxID=187734 RepID=A0A4Q4NDJ7_ALTAL|nr:wd repeat-containing protein [Alternaria alternata]RYN53547.1 hypothetical protein AA0118_g9572 [Alternaria tenuissima]RYN62148.1 hypothetical protein AA0114_g619 [Alternaria tenuissima]RYN73265.1 hypothetical protein AA0117_g7950 [Alternaria alternata]RYN86019.1 hypothetical protein AA0120_g8121 [Alternaria tenuissima]